MNKVLFVFQQILMVICGFFCVFGVHHGLHEYVGDAFSIVIGAVLFVLFVFLCYKVLK